MIFVAFVAGLFIGAFVGVFAVAILNDRIVDEETEDDGEEG